MINKTVKYRCYISKETYVARVMKRLDERILEVRLVSDDGNLTDLPLRYIDENHLADSFGQIRPLDGCISLNQNDGEKTVNVGRGYVIKQRDGKSRFSFFLEFNPETLRIRQLSKEKYKSTMAKHFEQASDETEVDSISYSGSTKRRKKMTEEDKVEQVVKKGWEPSKPDND